MTINERMMYSTVRIEGRLATGEDVAGTGFFLSHTTPAGSKVRMLVSNPHVVRGVRRGMLHLHRPRATTTRGQVIPTSSVPAAVDDFEPRWVPHPDPVVDLCALPYDVVHAAVRATGQDVYGTFFEAEQVIPPDEEQASVDAAEEVQLIGYPDAVWDRVNSFPVFRRGTIASHPRVDFHGRPEILIDIASAYGCSGSPVVVLSRTTFKEHEAECWPVVLLGVLSSGFGRSPDGVTREDLVSRAGARRLAPGTIHLGAIVKARELQVLAEVVAAKGEEPGGWHPA
jgi:hypothetical protein